MPSNFINLIREPDDVKVQTATSPVRFEEPTAAYQTDARVTFEIDGAVLKVILHPSSDAPKWLRIRFAGEQRGVTSLLGDTFARATETDLIWKSFVPQERMPWYFYTFDGHCLHGYGVRTGCNCFAYWQADPYGITLWLDVRNGASGVQLKESLVCAEIVCREGKEEEAPFLAAKAFCSMMCPTPNLPREPVFGFNNWYWAYGGIDEKTVLAEAEYLSRFTKGCQHMPYMVIDDGWQINHARGYNGGPWDRCNEQFGGMQETAQKIRDRGCRPGIWIRLLLTMEHVPAEAVYPSPNTKFGTVLDPSHPFTMEHVATDISRIAAWGYDLIKHDFSTMDLFGRVNCLLPNGLPKSFYDKTRTSAQILTDFYRTVQNNAGHALVIGCDTVNHLAAGIHQIQRVGDDTSGHCFEWTRRHGIHSMMRLPQNMTFFKVDPDCSAFTDRVSKELNFDYMEATALSGCAAFTSVKPGILTPEEEKRMSEILRLADSVTPEEAAVPTDFTRTSAPAEFLFRGNEYFYNWYREHSGARSYLSWME